MKFKASKDDMTVHLITIGIIILFVFLVYESIKELVHANGLTPIPIHSSVIFSLSTIVSLCFLYAPVSYTKGTELFKKKNIPMYKIA